VAGDGDYDPAELARAASRLRWPVLATAASGLREHDVITTYHHLLVSGVPTSLLPEVVVCVGGVGPSDRLGALTALPVPQVHIDRWGVWRDPRRHSTLMLQADPVATLDAIDPVDDDGSIESWRRADAVMRAALDQLLGAEVTGPAVARNLGSVGQERTVVASSMPIRDVDAHTTGVGKVIANRGASGIDGFVSTALGVASTGDRTVALSGDLSLLHDAAGFVADQSGDVVFLVIDNGGGGLFDLLPQAVHAPSFERLFVTPHGLDLARLASGYGLDALLCDQLDSLPGVVNGLLDERGTHLVIVPVDRAEDLRIRRSLDDASREVCAGLS
jgi:2-succinyl-5-enolpyruvyl-6-hydroxy-3-cyclohexene-1-carboxylate synthase